MCRSETSTYSSPSINDEPATDFGGTHTSQVVQAILGMIPLIESHAPVVIEHVGTTLMPGSMLMGRPARVAEDILQM
jgi:hypothetical protein